MTILFQTGEELFGLMQDRVIHISGSTQILVKRAAAILLMCLLIGSMIAFFSPSVTFTMDPDERLSFWIILCLVGGAGIFLGDLILERVFANGHVGLKSLIQTIFGLVAVLIPLFSIYGPEELPSIQASVLFVWTVMALIVAGTFALTRMFEKPEKQAPSVNAEQNIETRPKILSRLPVHLQDAQLYALSAEDHYVRIHTSKGEDMLLMRLSDSIAEAGNVEGSQTHRSWWVAKDAVEDIKKLGRTAEIKLKNGQTALVSRSGLKTLKDIGWL